MSDQQAEPQGPQINDADLRSMSNHDLAGLAAIVWLDYVSAKALHEEGDLSDEEFRWVYSDAERVRDELIRRDIERGESWTL